MTYSPYETETVPVAPADASSLDELDGLNGLSNSADEDLDLGDDSAEDDAAESGNGAAKAKNQAKSNRALFRRVAAKALEVQSASDDTRALAASLLGSSDDVVDLTAAIMTAPRSATAALTDIEELSAALIDAPWEAGITATSMGRPRLRAVWSLLHTLGTVGTPAAPASDAKAANAVLKALNGLGADSKTELTAAGDLLKRS